MLYITPSVQVVLLSFRKELICLADGGFHLLLHNMRVDWPIPKTCWVLELVSVNISVTLLFWGNDVETFQIYLHLHRTTTNRHGTQQVVRAWIANWKKLELPWESKLQRLVFDYQLIIHSIFFLRKRKNSSILAFKLEYFLVSVFL